MGGWSSEREISVQSGLSVYRNLDNNKYNKCLFNILKDKRIQITPENIEITENSLTEIPAINLIPALLLLQNWGIDAAFLVTHGTGGEDGVLQGFLEMFDIAYTHSDIRGSAVAMDKEISKYIYAANQIPTPACFILQKNSDVAAEFKNSGFQFPIISKAISQGSSVGIFQCHDLKELEEKVQETLNYSSRVMIEEYVKQREFTCAVIETTKGLQALAVTEIITQTEFFDYNAKYYDKQTKEIVPAEIPEALALEIQELAKRAHQALKCSGASRSDVLQDATGKLYVIETNTIPGMTEQSLLPKAAGISEFGFSGVLDLLIDNALTRNKN